MSIEEENKALIRRYTDGAWVRRDWSVAEEFVAEDVVFHDQAREGELPPGREGLRVGMEQMFTGAPDLVFEVKELMADGDLVALRWEATGTHAGVFNNIPGTGRPLTVYGISIVRIEDGRIVEGWQESDRLGMLQMMGLFPKGAPPRPVGAAMAWRVRFRDRLARRRRL